MKRYIDTVLDKIDWPRAWAGFTALESQRAQSRYEDDSRKGSLHVIIAGGDVWLEIEPDPHTAQESFSVGIFQCVPRNSGKGGKKSAVKVRVRGYVSQPTKVYDRAKEIIIALDAGTYTGPKNVTVA